MKSASGHQQLRLMQAHNNIFIALIALVSTILSAFTVIVVACIYFVHRSLQQQRHQLTTTTLNAYKTFINVLIFELLAGGLLFWACCGITATLVWLRLNYTSTLLAIDVTLISFYPMLSQGVVLVYVAPCKRKEMLNEHNNQF